MAEKKRPLADGESGEGLTRRQVDSENIPYATANINSASKDILKTTKHIIEVEVPEKIKLELNSDELNEFYELSGKLIDNGTDKAEADFLAAKVIAEKQKKGKTSRFIRIGGAKIEPARWIVKNCIERGSFNMGFGDSETFKSFWAIALAASVATGKEFYGLAVKMKGAVFYIAAEGRRGIIQRFRAWSQENAPINQSPLYLYDGAVNLIEATNILISALADVIKNESAPPALVIIDTWARSLGDDDSNTSAAQAGQYKIDKIREAFPDIAVLIIHHTGHQNKDRARGASLLHAAVDSEFRLELDKEKNIIMTNTKSKENEPLKTMAFKRRSVKLLDDNGKYILDEDGEIETSLVLDLIEDYTEPIEGLGIEQRWIIETLKRQESKSLIYDDLLNAYKTEKPKKRKSELDRPLKSLEEKGVIYRETGFICLS